MFAALNRAAALLVLLVILPLSCVAATSPAAPWAGLLAKDSLTILVTDSGLGGLSVVADAEQRLRASGVYANVDLIFCNALFTTEGGYNSLPERADKIRVFSNALQAFADRYRPDIILIACNTLSVLYRDTDFAATTTTPIVGIVEDGVALIADRMQASDDSRTIIFATETTVDEGAHLAALVARGIQNERIITQKCPQLAAYIEQGYDSMSTEFLIEAYVDEALGTLGKAAGPLYVSFNCTHFGYSLDAWRNAFKARGIAVAEFLNPNTTMFDFLIPPELQGRFAQTALRLSMVSMVPIPADSRESIGRYLHDISPATETALENHELRPDLFTWRDALIDSTCSPRPIRE